jgi:hypothetical protein
VVGAVDVSGDGGVENHTHSLLCPHTGVKVAEKDVLKARSI